MIIVKLQGGLGNQMFQYAAGRALALRHNTELQLDLTFLKGNPAGAYTARQYGLDVFRIKAEMAVDKDLNDLRKKSNRVSRMVQRSFPFLFSKLEAVESGFGYHQAFERFPKNTYLDGYWQSEKYFDAIQQIIREDFEPALKMPEKVNELLKLITSAPSVCLHVRRGDFVSLPGAAAYHGNLTTTYYLKALESLPDRLAKAPVYIFSDDPAWCNQEFGFLSNRINVDLQEAAVWDMYLMSRCSAQVIANSSFSWWAAWLNPDPEKIIIMPAQWYTHTNTVNAGLHVPGWKML